MTPAKRNVDLFADRLFLRTLVLCVLAILPGCAGRRTALQPWRLIGAVLVPPGADAGRQIVAVKVPADGGICPPGIRTHGKSARITVTRDVLSQKPSGWLTAWTEELESDRCIAPGASAEVAATIASALPLELNEMFRLLYATDPQSGEVDLDSRLQLQVVSPITVDGKPYEAPTPLRTTGAGNNLDAAVAAPNLLGYETALYGVRPRAASAGFTIVPLSAEKHIAGGTEPIAQPAVNYFRFAEDAAWFRLYYKTGQTDFTALVIAAPARAKLTASAASCEGITPGMCVAIPRHVAVNPLITITVNGSATTAGWGSTVGAAMRATGSRSPESAVTGLSVMRLYQGHLAAVEFDRSSPAILQLLLTGGESISWH